VDFKTKQKRTFFIKQKTLVRVRDEEARRKKSLLITATKC
jgi:hypothetical protein